MMHARFRIVGFSLIELTTVLMVSALITGVIAQSMVVPIQVYGASRRSGELIYRANLITQRLNHDLAQAVSGSVRIRSSGSSTAVEYLHAVDVRRYHGLSEVADDTAIAFATQQTPRFSIWGPWSTALSTGSHYTGNYQSLAFIIANIPFDQIGTDTSLSVYSSGNQSSTGVQTGRLNSFNGPLLSSVITPKASLSTQEVWQILPPDAASAYPSDGRLVFNYALDAVNNPVFPVPGLLYDQWVYASTGPVSYVCDLSTTPGVLRRYSGYELRATQPILSADFTGDGTVAYQWRSDAPIVSTILSDRVSACSVQYANKILTWDISLNSGEQTMRIVNQVYVAH